MGRCSRSYRGGRRRHLFLAISKHPLYSWRYILLGAWLTRYCTPTSLTMKSAGGVGAKAIRYSLKPLSLTPFRDGLGHLLNGTLDGQAISSFCALVTTHTSQAVHSLRALVVLSRSLNCELPLFPTWLVSRFPLHFFPFVVRHAYNSILLWRST